MAKKKTEDVGPDTPVKRPRVSIVERRTMNPFGEPSFDIQFKRKDITARWFNEDLHAGQQIYRAKNSLGWEPVTPDMIADRDSLGAHSIDAAGHIVRGARGSEHLMWMLRAEAQAIADAKVRENNRRMASPNAQRNEVLEAYGSVNPDGADIISRSVRGMQVDDDHPVGLHATVKDGVERIERNKDLA